MTLGLNTDTPVPAAFARNDEHVKEFAGTVLVRTAPRRPATVSRTCHCRDAVANRS
jgi:hypothetical protein